MGEQHNTITYYRYKHNNVVKVPVKEFLFSLPLNQKDKVSWKIGMLAKYGTELREPHVKAIKGNSNKGLWEIKIHLATSDVRIIYSILEDNTFILLHAFFKAHHKSNKKSNQITVQREIEIAKRYMIEYQRRCVRI